MEVLAEEAELCTHTHRAAGEEGDILLHGLQACEEPGLCDADCTVAVKHSR